MITLKLQGNLIEITLRHGCSPVNLLHIFRTPFAKITSASGILSFDFTSAVCFKIQMDALTGPVASMKVDQNYSLFARNNNFVLN